jgi:hypothetical protein
MHEDLSKLLTLYQALKLLLTSKINPSEPSSLYNAQEFASLVCFKTLYLALDEDMLSEAFVNGLGLGRTKTV